MMGTWVRGCYGAIAKIDFMNDFFFLVLKFQNKVSRVSPS